MWEWLNQLNFEGIIIGACTFIIIGLFHPLVIKGYYYLGLKCRIYFLIAGLIFLILSLIVTNNYMSILSGVTSFSCFWSILEVNEQKERVAKGWFPENPKRKENR